MVAQHVCGNPAGCQLRCGGERRRRPRQRRQHGVVPRALAQRSVLGCLRQGRLWSCESIPSDFCCSTHHGIVPASRTLASLVMKNHRKAVSLCRHCTVKPAVRRCCQVPQGTLYSASSSCVLSCILLQSLRLQAKLRCSTFRLPERCGRRSRPPGCRCSARSQTHAGRSQTPAHLPAGSPWPPWPLHMRVGDLATSLRKHTYPQS